MVQSGEEHGGGDGKNTTLTCGGGYGIISYNKKLYIFDIRLDSQGNIDILSEKI